MTAATADLIARAATHLHHAALHAEHDWHPTLAGQIRLAAASLPALPGPEPRPESEPDAGPPLGEEIDVAGLLALALDCLDQITPLDGPADLQLVAWHIHELHRIVTSGVLS